MLQVVDGVRARGRRAVQRGDVGRRGALRARSRVDGLAARAADDCSGSRPPPRRPARQRLPAALHRSAPCGCSPLCISTMNVTAWTGYAGMRAEVAAVSSGAEGPHLVRHHRCRRRGGGRCPRRLPPHPRRSLARCRPARGDDCLRARTSPHRPGRGRLACRCRRAARGETAATASGGLGADPGRRRPHVPGLRTHAPRRRPGRRAVRPGSGGAGGHRLHRRLPGRPRPHRTGPAEPHGRSRPVDVVRVRDGDRLGPGARPPRDAVRGPAAPPGCS